MLIRIYYTFMNANGCVAWDQSLFDVEGPEQALRQFQQVLPSFALQRLQTLHMTCLDAVTGKHATETPMLAEREACKQFIKMWRKPNEA